MKTVPTVPKLQKACASLAVLGVILRMPTLIATSGKRAAGPGKNNGRRGFIKAWRRSIQATLPARLPTDGSRGTQPRMLMLR